MRHTVIAVLLFVCSTGAFAQSSIPSEPPRLVTTPPVTKTGERPRVVVAPVPEVPGGIRVVRMITTTGTDDLRRDSQVTAFFLLKDGRRIESQALNCRVVEERKACPGFANGSRHTLEWKIDPPAQVRPDEIHRFGLAFLSGRPGPLDSGDNWNLNKLEVEYVVSKPDPARNIAAGTFPLLKLTRVHRFKTNETWESEPLTLPAPVKP